MSGFPAAAAPMDSHPFSVHDLLAMDRISGNQVSPDGKWVVFVLRKTDLKANRGRTDLWMMAADGSGLRRLTSDPSADFSPIWGTDNRSIWFISTRSGSAQVWKICRDGGEAQAVTRLPLDVENLVVSRDGCHLAVTMRVFPGLSPAETVDRMEKIRNSPVTGRLFKSLFIRHWDTWNDGRRSHLFVLPVTVAGDAAVSRP